MAPAVPVSAALGDPPPPETHDPAGSGQLQGTELIEMQGGFPCFRATRTLMGLRGAGTLEGRTPAGDRAVYRAQTDTGQTLYGNGPLQVQPENTEVYYHGPFGTHGTEAGGGAGCSPSTAGTPVPAEFRIFAAEGTQDADGDSDVDVLTGAAWVYRLNATGDKVPCVGVGSFARNVGDWWAEWTLSADCVVAGNAAGTPGTGTAPRGTFMTHRGGHGPCFEPPCVDNLQVDYQQFLPKPGPYLRLTGPATATVGCEQAATITARLTDTGWPAAGVPLSFSVAGPGPAAPPGANATTDNNGAAAFSFTAALAGDYSVTATATLNGALVSATHTVRFANPPPLRLTLASPPGRSQTEEQVPVTATVAEACGPLAGAPVDFTVTWPAQDTPWTGQATPASGTVITGADGTATFSFSGDRAGDYRVSATTSRPGQTASDTRTLHLDIRDFKRNGAVPSTTSGHLAAVIDPAGRYAYFAGRSAIIKLDLATFEQVDALPIRNADNVDLDLRSAVIDPAGRFAYFGDLNATIHKVDLATFELVGAAQVGVDYEFLETAVIDPAGRFAYFAGAAGPNRVLKVDLATLTLAAALPLQIGDQSFGHAGSAVMDPAGGNAYFGTSDGANGWLVKVDLAGFQIDQTLVLPSSERRPEAGVIDPAGDFAYFGMGSGAPSPLQPGTPDYGAPVVKFDLRTFKRVGAITLAPTEDIGYQSGAAVMDPAGRFAYFGVEQGYDATRTQPLPAGVVKVDLGTFERANAITLEAGASGEDRLSSAVIDPAGGHAYFGTYAQGRPYVAPSDRVVRFQLRRPPHPALAADADTYATEFETPLTAPAPGVLEGDTDTDGDPIVAGQASDPAGGSVTLNPSGSFTYTPDANFAGTDTFTYTASDGMNYSAPATVSVVVAPPAGLTGRAYGFQSNVSLFGGPSEQRGPAPTVTLPVTGSATPVTATAATGDARYGPADIFTSGQLDVSTQGSMGPNPSVTTTATVANVNRDLNEKLTAAGISATCSATKSGVSGSTTITNGVLQTSEGDPKVDGDETNIALPPNPVPNTAYEGQIETVGDRFRYVFNEQIHNPDGSITVYAAHQYILGPTAIGHLYIGKVECGVPDVPAVVRAVADFDADGDTDRSVFRDGAWFAEGQPTAYFGLAGDIPVAGDYDGNASLERAVYRDGAWLTEGQPTVYLGLATDLPVPGDYDGDGDTDRAVFRPSLGAWYIEGREPIFHGAPGDVPVPGDYDANGTTDVGIWRPSVGGWYIAGQATEYIGLEGDIPVPGDYDGNGSTDRGIWRPAVGRLVHRRPGHGVHRTGGRCPRARRLRRQRLHRPGHLALRSRRLARRGTGSGLPRCSRRCPAAPAGGHPRGVLLRRVST